MPDGLKIKIETKDSVKEIQNLNVTVNKFGADLKGIETKLDSFNTGMDKSIKIQKQISEALKSISQDMVSMNSGLANINNNYKKLNQSFTQINNNLKLNTNIQQNNINVTKQATSVVNNFNTVVKKSKTSIFENVNKLNDLGKSFINLGKDATKASEESKKFYNRFKDTQNIKKAQDALKFLKKEVGLTIKELKAYGNQAGLTKKQINEITDSNTKLQKSNKNVHSSFSSLKTLLPTIGIGLVAKAFIETALSVDRFEKGLAAATGSMSSGAEASVFLLKTSKELGVEYEKQVIGYQQLAAAARGTSLEGKETEKIFIAVAEASVALQLTSYQTEKALYAMQQMISKGNVQSEELRRQLGEQLPGAFQIAARSLGTTTEGLNKMLKAGTVIAEDFLPKFAKALRAHYAGALEASTQSLQSNINRAKTSWFEFKKTVMEDTATNTLNQTIKELTESFDEWLQVNKELIQQDVAGFIQGLVAVGGDLKDVFDIISKSLSSVYGGVKDILDVVPKELYSIGLLGLVAFGTVGGGKAVIAEVLTFVGLYKELIGYVDTLLTYNAKNPELANQMKILDDIKLYKQQLENLRKPQQEPMMQASIQASIGLDEKQLIEKIADLSSKLKPAIKKAIDETNKQAQDILKKNQAKMDKLSSDYIDSLFKAGETNKARKWAAEYAKEKEKAYLELYKQDEKLFKESKILTDFYEKERLKSLDEYLNQLRKSGKTEEQIEQARAVGLEKIYKHRNEIEKKSRDDLLGIYNRSVKDLGMSNDDFEDITKKTIEILKDLNVDEVTMRDFYLDLKDIRKKRELDSEKKHNDEITKQRKAALEEYRKIVNQYKIEVAKIDLSGNEETLSESKQALTKLINEAKILMKQIPNVNLIKKQTEGFDVTTTIKSNELEEKAVENAKKTFEEIKNFSEDTVYDIITDWNNGFESLSNNMLNMFKKAFAKIANEKIIMPIVDFAMGGSGSGSIFSGLFSGAGGISSAGGEVQAGTGSISTATTTTVGSKISGASLGASAVTGLAAGVAGFALQNIIGQSNKKAAMEAALQSLIESFEQASLSFDRSIEDLDRQLSDRYQEHPYAEEIYSIKKEHQVIADDLKRNLENVFPDSNDLSVARPDRKMFEDAIKKYNEAIEKNEIEREKELDIVEKNIRKRIKELLPIESNLVSSLKNITSTFEEMQIALDEVTNELYGTAAETFREKSDIFARKYNINESSMTLENLTALRSLILTNPIPYDNSVQEALAGKNLPTYDWSGLRDPNAPTPDNWTGNDIQNAQRLTDFWDAFNEELDAITKKFPDLTKVTVEDIEEIKNDLSKTGEFDLGELELLGPLILEASKDVDGFIASIDELIEGLEVDLKLLKDYHISIGQFATGLDISKVDNILSLTAKSGGSSSIFSKNIFEESMSNVINLLSDSFSGGFSNAFLNPINEEIGLLFSELDLSSENFNDNVVEASKGIADVFNISSDKMEVLLKAMDTKEFKDAYSTYQAMMNEYYTSAPQIKKNLFGSIDSKSLSSLLGEKINEALNSTNKYVSSPDFTQFGIDINNSLQSSLKSALVNYGVNAMSEMMMNSLIEPFINAMSVALSEGTFSIKSFKDAMDIAGNIDIADMSSSIVKFWTAMGSENYDLAEQIYNDNKEGFDLLFNKAKQSADDGLGDVKPDNSVLVENIEISIETGFENVEINAETLSNNIETSINGTLSSINIEPITSKTSKEIPEKISIEDIINESIENALSNSGVRSKSRSRSYTRERELSGNNSFDEISFYSNGDVYSSGNINIPSDNNININSNSNADSFRNFEATNMYITFQNASIDEIRGLEQLTTGLQPAKSNVGELAGGLSYGSGAIDSLFNIFLEGLEDLKPKVETTYTQTLQNIKNLMKAPIDEIQYYANAFNDLFTPGTFDKFWEQFRIYGSESKSPEEAQAIMRAIDHLVGMQEELGLNFDDYQRQYYSSLGQSGTISVDMTDFEKSLHVLQFLLEKQAKEGFKIQGQEIMKDIYDSVGKTSEYQIELERINKQFQDWIDSLEDIDQYTPERRDEIEGYRLKAISEIDIENIENSYNSLLGILFEILSMTGELVTLDKTLFDINVKFDEFSKTLNESNLSIQEKIDLSIALEEKRIIAIKKATKENEDSLKQLTMTIGNSVGIIDSTTLSLFNLGIQFDSWEQQLIAFGKSDWIPLLKDAEIKAINNLQEERISPYLLQIKDALGIITDPMDTVKKYATEVFNIPEEEQTIDFFKNVLNYLSNSNILKTLTDDDLEIVDILSNAFIELNNVGSEAVNSVTEFYKTLQNTFIDGLKNLNDEIKNVLDTEGFLLKKEPDVLKKFLTGGNTDIINLVTGIQEVDEKNISDLLTWMQGMLSKTIDSINTWKDLQTQSENVLNKIKDIYKDEENTLNEIPELLNMSTDNVSDYIENMSTWIDNVSTLRNKVLSFQETILNQQKSMQKELNIELAGSKQNYIGFFLNKQIEKGFESLNEDVSIEEKLERANELNSLIMERYDLEKEELSNLKDTIEELDGLIDVIDDKIFSLQYSDFNLTPQGDIVEQAKIDYQKLFEKAKTGDQDAINEYLNFIDVYLKEAQDLYKSSQQYTDIWNKVNEDLNSLGSDVKGRKSDQEIYVEEFEKIVLKTNDVLNKLFENTDAWETTLDQAISLNTDQLETLPKRIGDEITNKLQLLYDSSKFIDETNNALRIIDVAQLTSNVKENAIKESYNQVVDVKQTKIPGINYDSFAKEVDNMLENVGNNERLPGLIKESVSKAKSYGITDSTQFAEIYSKYGRHTNEFSKEFIIKILKELTGFADGGISTKPMLAMVSEGRYNTEAHIPMPDGRTIPVTINNKSNSKNDMSETNRLLEAILSQQNITVNVGNKELKTFVRYEADGVRVEADNYGKPGVRLY